MEGPIQKLVYEEYNLDDPKYHGNNYDLSNLMLSRVGRNKNPVTAEDDALA